MFSSLRNNGYFVCFYSFAVYLLIITSVHAYHTGVCHPPDGPLVIYEDRFSQGWHVSGSWGGAYMFEVPTPGGLGIVTGTSLNLYYPNAWNGTGLYADNLNASIADKDALTFLIRVDQTFGDIRVGFHRSSINSIDIWKNVSDYIRPQWTPMLANYWYAVRIPKSALGPNDSSIQGIVFQSTFAGNAWLDNVAFTHVPAGAPPMLLSFPLQCSTPSCSGSGNINYSAGAYTPSTVTSVLDHSMKKNPANGFYPYGNSATVDGIVHAWTNEVAKGSPESLGCYPKVGGGTFSIDGTYIGTPSLGCGTDKLNYDDHPGYDYKADEGTAVKAAASGTVVSIDNERCYKNNLAGSCDDWGAVGIDHGNGYITQYLHLSYIGVNSGQWVNEGGEIGKSGKKAPVPLGPHLHFEVLKKVGSAYKVVDPYGWVGACDDDPLYKVMGECSHKLWK